MMNFIIKLLKSKKSVEEIIYDFIFIMMNQLIKYTHIISFKETYFSEQLKYVILNKLIQHNSISKTFVNNRDKLFMLKF